MLHRLAWTERRQDRTLGYMVGTLEDMILAASFPLLPLPLLLLPPLLFRGWLREMPRGKVRFRRSKRWGSACKCASADIKVPQIRSRLERKRIKRGNCDLVCTNTKYLSTHLEDTILIGLVNRFKLGWSKLSIVKPGSTRGRGSFFFSLISVSRHA